MKVINNTLPAVADHRLDRLLKPKSIALVGVSPRPGTVGSDMLEVLHNGGYQGKVFW